MDCGPDILLYRAYHTEAKRWVSRVFNNASSALGKNLCLHLQSLASCLRHHHALARGAQQPLK